MRLQVRRGGCLLSQLLLRELNHAVGHPTAKRAEARSYRRGVSQSAFGPNVPDQARLITNAEAAETNEARLQVSNFTTSSLGTLIISNEGLPAKHAAAAAHNERG